MKPKEKGDLAVAQAINYFMSNGYEVCLPIGDKRPYDLVVELEGVLYRVQIKYAVRKESLLYRGEISQTAIQSQ